MATDERRMEQVKSVLECMGSISCTAVTTEVNLSLPTTEGNEVYARWFPHVLNDDQRATCVFLATIHLQHWINDDREFLYCILTVDESWMHSFDPKLK